MARHHVDFVTLHLAAQSHPRLVGDNARAQLARPLLHVIFVQIQLLGNLLVREV